MGKRGKPYKKRIETKYEGKREKDTRKNVKIRREGENENLSLSLPPSLRLPLFLFSSVASLFSFVSGVC